MTKRNLKRWYSGGLYLKKIYIFRNLANGPIYYMENKNVSENFFLKSKMRERERNRNRDKVRERHRPRWRQIQREMESEREGKSEAER